MKLNIETKQPGQELQAAEVNNIVTAINEVDDDVQKPSHAFSELDFKVEGTVIIGGNVVPVIRLLNPGGSGEVPGRPELLAVLGIMPESSLPPVYMQGGSGSGTQNDPFIVGSEMTTAKLATLMQSLPGWAADKILQGDMSWITPPTSGGPKLGNTVLTNGTPTGDSIPLSWTAIANGITYSVQRDINIAFPNPVSIYSGTGLSYTDIGLTPTTAYKYRVRVTAPGYTASDWVTLEVSTGSSGNTTPAPPTVVGDDTANTLSATHALGLSEIVVSVADAAYIQLTAVSGWNGATSKIDVGDVDRAAGYYKFKIKSASGRNESTVVNSPAFTASVAIVKYMTGFTALDLNNGLKDGVHTDTAGVWTCSKSTGKSTTKYNLIDQAEVAFKVMGTSDESSTIGVMHANQIGNLQGIAWEAGKLYQVSGGGFDEFVGAALPVAGDWLIVKYNAATTDLLVYKSTDGINRILLTPPANYNVSPTTRLVAVEFANIQGMKFYYPQGKGTTVNP